MEIFRDIAMVVLCIIAASCGVIGMIASIIELIITRRRYLPPRRDGGPQK